VEQNIWDLYDSRLAVLRHEKKGRHRQRRKLLQRPSSKFSEYYCKQKFSLQAVAITFDFFMWHNT